MKTHKKNYLTIVIKLSLSESLNPWAKTKLCIYKGTSRTVRAKLSSSTSCELADILYEY